MFLIANRLTSRPKGFCEPVLENLTQMILLKKNGKDITTDMVDAWSEIYKPYDMPKYMRLTKSYKKDYSYDTHMVALESTNTNLKRFLNQMKYDSTKFKVS